MNAAAFIPHVAVQQEHSDARILNREVGRTRDAIRACSPGSGLVALRHQTARLYHSLDLLDNAHRQRQTAALGRLGLDI